MTVVDLKDFSGGIKESFSVNDFTERQWAKLRGFVLESETELRSQWECQRVGGSGFASVRTFVTKLGTFLVAVKTDGTLHWAVAPSRTASNTVCNAVSWTPVTSGTLATNSATVVSIVPNTAYRFIAELQILDGAAYQSGLLIHSLSGTAPAVVLYASTAGVLTARCYTNFYPTAYLGNPASVPPGAVTGDTALDTKTYATGGVMPRANVGCMWGNFLVLGDVEWAIDPNLPLSSSNVKRYSNALWISMTDNNGVPAPDRFLPVDSMNFVGTPEAAIRGLLAVDRGLLVFTTSATSGDGVVLLRGTPPVGDGVATYTPEVIRGGMGAVRETVDVFSPVHALWPEAGSIVFVEDKGTVWQTNGADASRVDRYGPSAPAAAVQTDHVAAVGPYLFVARDGRLLCMRMFTQDGAWTEIVPPAGVIRSMSTAEDCLYFVAGSSVYRFAFAGPNRGHVDGVPVPLTVATRTLGDDSEHLLHSWFRVAVRATGVNGAVMSSLSSIAGSSLLTAPKLETVSGATVGLRQELFARGHGPSLEASVEAVFLGDVIVESVSVWSHGKEPSR